MQMAALASGEGDDSDDNHAAEWIRHAVNWIYGRNSCSGNNGGGGVCVCPAELMDLMQSASPPPPSLEAMWDQCVWKLQDEPASLYRLRCLARSSGQRGGAMTKSGAGSPRFSFLLDTQSDLLPLRTSPVLGEMSKCGPKRYILRVVALRLIPTTTDVVQLGWCASVSRSLRPVYESRTHVVIQLLVSGKHFSAWAYGDVGAQLRIGAVMCAVVYATHTEDGDIAYVLHNVSELDTASSIVVACDEDNSVDGAWSRATKTSIHPSLSIPPAQLSFAKLLDVFAPDIAGQKLCKSLLFLVAVHTMYRAVRCRFRQPLHMLLLGPSRSGKSALLRWFLRLLGPHATLVGHHVVYGQRRLASFSQAITATYPHVRQQLLLGGAVSTVDALVIDELSSRGCAGHVEGLMGGVCSIIGAGGGGGGVGSSSASLQGLRSHVARIKVQVTAAANDDFLAAEVLLPHFALIVRTTAQLSIRSTASIGDGVVAASLARSQSSSLTLSRSVSLCEPSPRRADTAQPTGSLSHEFLLAVVTEAPPPSVFEAAIPVGVFTRFYLRCLGKYFGSSSGDSTPTTPLGSQLAVLWELNVARLILESRGSSNTPIWSETLAEEVWQYYKHHLCTVDTAAATAGLGASDHDAPHAPLSNTALPASRVRAKRNRPGKKAVCVRLLRMMEKAQQVGDGAAIPEERVKIMYEQIGGEEQTGQSFATVIQQLMDAALIIRRLNAYAVVGEV